MKKRQALAFIAAIAVTTTIIGVTGREMGEIEQAAGNVAASVQNSEEVSEEAAATDGILYDEAIEELYERSSELTDEEIFEIAEKMIPDMSAVESALGEEEAAAIEQTLHAYGDEKSDYILSIASGEADASADSSVSVGNDVQAEWDKQYKYTMISMTSDQTLTRLISGINVTACEVEDGTVTLDIDEWMTEGYTQGSDVENASAYRYYATLTLQNQDGAWYVASVENTDQNFTWTQDIDEQLEQYDLTAEDLSAAVENDASEAIATSSLTLYGANTYTYNVDAAVAYADKWATSRNPEYKSYPGVDCANFVSQSLYAGGMPKNSKWYPASYSWINVSGAIANFKNYGTFMTANNSNVLKGNPVYYDWNSNGVYDHTAICVGTNSSGTPIVDAHTGDHYHVTWQLGSNGTRATIQLRSNGTVTDTATTGGSWKKESGSWYYYSASGTKLTGWLQSGSNWYYLGSSGKMCTSWTYIGGKWYYFGTDGAMKTGWITVAGKSYYLNDGGVMATGWLKKDNSWYYLGSDGVMQKGWQTISGNKYYFAQDGKMSTGLTEIEGNLYYFGTNGAMTYGWQTIGGKKYFFSTSAEGQAAVGQWRVGGKVYSFSSEGVLIQ